MIKKYKCPICKRKNQASGMCAEYGVQIVCDECTIMYYSDGRIDSFLTEVLRMGVQR